MSKNSTMLSQTAYQYILDLIMSQELLPGDKIPETRIAQEFQISRTPVRDAMQKLANEGILEIFPNRFAQVKKYTMAQITEIGTLRLALDGMAIKLAGLFGSRSDFLKLADLASQCEDAYKRNDMAAKSELDCKFHQTLAEISRNELLIKFQKELYTRIRYIMLCYPHSVEFESEHIHEHAVIADALLRGDHQLAHTIITEHISSFYGLRDKYPADFF